MYLNYLKRYLEKLLCSFKIRKSFNLRLYIKNCGETCCQIFYFISFIIYVKVKLNTLLLPLFY